MFILSTSPYNPQKLNKLNQKNKQKVNYFQLSIVYLINVYDWLFTFWTIYRESSFWLKRQACELDSGGW